MHEFNGIIHEQESNPNILVNGASIAYSIRVEDDKRKLHILENHLNIEVIFKNM